MMSLIFVFSTQEVETQLQRFHDTEAKFHKPKELEDHDGEKSKRIAGTDIFTNCNQWSDKGNELSPQL